MVDEAAEPDATVAERLAAHAHRTPQFVGVTDHRGNVVYLNPATRARFGIPPGAPLDLTTAALFTEAAFTTYFDEIRPAILRGEAWTGVLTVRVAEGELIDVAMTVTGGVGAGGEVTWLVTVGTDVTEQRREAELLRYRSLHDELTGLAGRALLLDRFEVARRRAERHGSLLAVVFVDVNGLKALNDAFGHRAGDELLVAVAQRLAAAVRAADTVARVGGDEFVVLLDGVAGEAEALELATRLRHAVEETPVRTGSTAIPAAVSVGVAVGDGSSDLDELLQRADRAMYAQKDEPASPTPRLAPIAGPTRHELAIALTQQRVVAYAAPVVEVPTGRTAGRRVEARWRRGDEVLPAAVFAHLADGSGLHLALDLAVLRQATAASRTAAGDLYVPVSARLLGEPQLASLLAEILGRSGLPPAHLHLEVPERLLARRTPGVLDALRTIRSLGARVVVGGVGIHAGAVVDLAEGLVDAIAVSPELVAGIGHDEVADRAVAGVIGLATGIGVATLATGVASIAQLARLADLGCDRASGPLFGEAEPVPA